MQLPDSEFAVIQLLWNRAPQAADDLIAQLGDERGWAASTVKTLLARLVRSAGRIVTHRQQPSTASGVIFATLEDETGTVNIIVWPSVAAAQRQALRGSMLLSVQGTWQAEKGVYSLVAQKLVNHDQLLGRLRAGKVYRPDQAERDDAGAAGGVGAQRSRPAHRAGPGARVGGLR